MKKVFLYLMLGLVCTTGMTSCSEENKEPGDVPLTGIMIRNDWGEISGISHNVRFTDESTRPSENFKLATIPPNATDVDFKFSSADPTVATVAETALGEGRVTVVGRGSTVIRVSSGGVTKEIPVEGRWDVAYLEDIRLVLTTDEEPTGGSDTTVIYTTLSVGDIIEVIASANPRNANTETVTYVTFNWKSDNPDVATVAENPGMTEAIDKTGKITVTGAGTANITISCTLDDDDETVIKAKTIIIKVP